MSWVSSLLTLHPPRSSTKQQQPPPSHPSPFSHLLCSRPLFSTQSEQRTTQNALKISCHAFHPGHWDERPLETGSFLKSETGHTLSPSLISTRGTWCCKQVRMSFDFIFKLKSVVSEINYSCASLQGYRTSVRRFVFVKFFFERLLAAIT